MIATVIPQIDVTLLGECSLHGRHLRPAYRPDRLQTQCFSRLDLDRNFSAMHCRQLDSPSTASPVDVGPEEVAGFRSNGYGPLNVATTETQCDTPDERRGKGGTRQECDR